MNNKVSMGQEPHRLKQFQRQNPEARRVKWAPFELSEKAYSRKTSTWNSGFLDHYEFWQIGVGKANRFVVSHPYAHQLVRGIPNDESVSELLGKGWHNDAGCPVWVYRTGLSWYNNLTYLVFTGSADVLESLNLDYLGEPIAKLF